MNSIRFRLLGILFTCLVANTAFSQWTDNGTEMQTNDDIRIDGRVRAFDYSDYSIMQSNNSGGYSEIQWGDDQSDRLRFFFNYHNGSSLDKEVMTLLSSGKVGIGIINPSATFQINGSGTIAAGNLNNAWALIGNSSTGIGIDENEIMNKGGNLYLGTIGANNLVLRTGGENNRLLIDPSGKVGIGTDHPESKLSVNGTIHSKEVKVDLDGWSDYVFADDYELMDLRKVDEYVKVNKHLPGIPTEEEVIAEGIELGAMNAKLLEKIEELTLYLIEQNVRIEEQEDRIKEQGERIKEQDEILKAVLGKLDEAK